MVMVNLSMQYVIAAEKAKEHEKELNVQVRSLLVDGAALSVARKRLQVIAISYHFSVIYFIFLIFTHPFTNLNWVVFLFLILQFFFLINFLHVS